MTISYNLDVSTSTHLAFFKLLFRWRGSIWKSIYTELITWLLMYYAIFCIYRVALDGPQQDTFDKIAQMFEAGLSYIPLTFMLGFFVTAVMHRWKEVYDCLAFIENVALTISTYVRDEGEEGTNLRRTAVRYLVLAQVLILRNVSLKVRRRFPTMESIIKAGFMFEHERQALEAINIPYNKYFEPVRWAQSLCAEALRKSKMSVSCPHYFLSELRTYRNKLGKVVDYDWVPTPLAYPQVVFLAVRLYFLICLVARQYSPRLVEAKAKNYYIDLYFPFMTVLQFIFLVGWMKVAEGMLNPFGEDDDDFEFNFLIDKNIATGLAIVDDVFLKYPSMTPDHLSERQYRAKGGFNNLVRGSVAALVIRQQLEGSDFDSESNAFWRRMKRKFIHSEQITRGMNNRAYTIHARQVDEDNDE